MIKQRTTFFSFFLYLGDLAATFYAFSFAYMLRNALPQVSYASLFPFSWYLVLLFIVFPVWSILFYILGLYRFWWGPGFRKEFWMIFKAVMISSFLLGFAVFAFKYIFVSRLFLFIFAFFNIFFVVFARSLIRAAIRFLNQKSENFRFFLIIGVGENARRLAWSIEKYKDLGLKILGFLRVTPSSFPHQLLGYPVMGSAKDLPQVLEKEVVDEVIFAISQEELKSMEECLLLCEERGITARVAMDFFPQMIAKTHLEDLDGTPLLTFSTTPKNELLLLFRRIFDLAGSLALVILFSPIFFLITAMIRLDTPGPALYRQTRYGLNGRKFTFLKFRSMIQGAEIIQSELAPYNMMDGPVFKMKDDPRITPVGRFLRKTSLDELPQLFNVLQGDMSFVGPRPPIPDEVEKYEGWQRRRLSMKPGITGLWQVSGRNQIDFDQWMKMDLEYIDNWSLWLDFKILLKTIPVVLSGKGAM